MLESLKLRYDPLEDRLVLTVAAKHGSDTSSQTLHLTRRLCAGWRADLEQVLRLSAQPPARLEPSAQAMVTAANHQALAAQAPRRSEPVTAREAARQAQLATRVTVGRERATGRWIVQFDVQQGSPLTLTLSDQTMHALIDAFNERIASAHWQLPPLQTQMPVGPAADADHTTHFH